MNFDASLLSGDVQSRRQLREEAANHLRQLIISGVSRPGDVLRLGPLAEQLDMSITPVREALLLLVQEGWVFQEPNRGFKVAPLQRRDIADSYLVGSFVAGELTARAAARITPAAIERLRALDASIEAAAAAERDDQSLLNSRLHAAIYEVAESPRLMSFSEVASSFVPRLFWTTIPGWRQFNKVAHTPIIDALERHDGEFARRAMAQHISQAGDLLLDHLDRKGFFVASEETG